MSTEHLSGGGLAGLPSRRTVLRAAAAAGAAATGVTLGAPPAAAHGTLVGHNEISGQYTWKHDRVTNQVTTNPYTFQYNATFYTRLESWLEYYYSHTPLNWLKPMKLYISHIHRDTTLPNGSLSMHGYGRAMDITRLYMTSYVDLGGGQREYYTFLAFNARANEIDHNPYGHWTWKWYWGAVASLMHHFNYVLHYHYPGHQDHVHADNAVNSGNSTFSTGSDTQVAFVQASLRNIWGYSTGIDGDWGPQTDSHSRGALARMGRTGGLTTSQANWLAFCEATRRFGTGKQSY